MTRVVTWSFLALWAFGCAGEDKGNVYFYGLALDRQPLTQDLHGLVLGGALEVRAFGRDEHPLHVTNVAVDDESIVSAAGFDEARGTFVITGIAEGTTRVRVETAEGKEASFPVGVVKPVRGEAHLYASDADVAFYWTGREVGVRLDGLLPDGGAVGLMRDGALLVDVVGFDAHDEPLIGYGAVARVGRVSPRFALEPAALGEIPVGRVTVASSVPGSGTLSLWDGVVEVPLAVSSEEDVGALVSAELAAEDLEGQRFAPVLDTLNEAVTVSQNSGKDMIVYPVTTTGSPIVGVPREAIDTPATFAAVAAVFPSADDTEAARDPGARYVFIVFGEQPGKASLTVRMAGLEKKVAVRVNAAR